MPTVAETTPTAYALEAEWEAELVARHGRRAYPLSRYLPHMNGSQMPIGDRLRDLYDAKIAASDAMHQSWVDWRATQRNAA